MDACERWDGSEDMAAAPGTVYMISPGTLNNLGAPRSVYMLPPGALHHCEHLDKSMGEAATAPKNVYMISP